MANNFDLSALALKAVCPSNEIICDNKGMPSIMVRIPKMTYKELGLGESTATHPAFIVNGTEVPEIYISKFQNVVMDGRAYSLPGMDPATTMGLDAAISYCSAKGEGWHLMTAAEWSVIALWCKANGTTPKGNNNFGKDVSETVYKAIPTLRDSVAQNYRPLRVATGTGPLSWSHDGTVSGIWDLNGNVWEQMGGMRLVNGELQVLANNNAADSANSQAAASNLWRAIKGDTGELVQPNGSGTTDGALRLDWVQNKWKWITGAITQSWPDGQGKACAFKDVSADTGVGEQAKLLLQALTMLPMDGDTAYDDDNFWAVNGDPERKVIRGGSWGNAATAGVFDSSACDSRAGADWSVGFRAAFVKLPAE